MEKNYKWEGRTPLKTDLAGKRFGRLLAVKPISVIQCGRRRTLWLCTCDCGVEKTIPRDSLIINTRSCGCLQREKFGNANRTHGGSDTDLYRIWSNIKDRCGNPNNHAFHNYGGRGIKLCKEWSDDFEAFAKGVGQRPSKNHSIDRVDNEKGYEPGNCKWSTKKEQGRNRRGLIETKDTTTLKEAAEKSGILYGTVYSRIFKHGWSIEDALTIPSKVGQKVRSRGFASTRYQP